MSIVFFTRASLGSVHCFIDIGRPTTTVTFNGPVSWRDKKRNKNSYVKCVKDEQHHAGGLNLNGYMVHLRGIGR